MLHDEHRQKVDALRQQLEAAELEIDRLHASRIAAAAAAAAANSSTATTTVGVSLSPDPRDMTAAADRLTDYPRELRGEERQSGEV